MQLISYTPFSRKVLAFSIDKLPGVGVGMTKMIGFDWPKPPPKLRISSNLVIFELFFWPDWDVETLIIVQ